MSTENLDMNVHSNITLMGQKWKQPTCPLSDENTNKMWRIHTME